MKLILSSIKEQSIVPGAVCRYPVAVCRYPVV